MKKTWIQIELNGVEEDEKMKSTYFTCLFNFFFIVGVVIIQGQEIKEKNLYLFV